MESANKNVLKEICKKMVTHCAVHLQFANSDYNL